MSKSVELIARGLAVVGGRVLLCRNDRGGYFYLPGGHVEFGEPAAHALNREFVEECGVQVRIGKLCLTSEGVFEARGKRHHEVNLVFHVELKNAKSVVSKEAGLSFHWIDLSTLATTDLRPAGMKAWLEAGGRSDVAWMSEIAAKGGGV